MFKKFFLGALIFVLAWGVFIPLNVGANGSVISLSSATVTAGEQATVTVSLAGVTDMVGFRIGVTWPEQLDYVSDSMALTSDTAGFTIVTNENVADYAGNGVLSSAASAYAVSGSLNLVTFRLLVPAGTAAGSYTLTINPRTRLNDGAIPVTFQNSTITVIASPAPTPPPTYPDLVVNTITLMQNSTAILSGNPQAGQSFYAQANFSNTGEAAVNNPFYINVYVDSVLNSHLAVSSALASSTSAKISNAVTLSTVGSHLISITIDSENSVTESNENNNTLNQTIAIVAAPVSSNSATTTPNNTTNSSGSSTVGGSTSGGGSGSSYLGQPDLTISDIAAVDNKIRITYSNIGTAAAPGQFKINLADDYGKLSSTGELEISKIVNESGILNIRASGYIDFGVLAGLHYLMATVDSNNNIIESNENNNTFTKKIDIQGCREYTTVSPEVEKECLAKGGKMVGGKDANGCATPPKCVLPLTLEGCREYTTVSPEVEKECLAKGGKMVGGKDANGCATPPKCVIPLILVCTQEYNPVCGVDNNTYSNRCVSEKQKKVKVAYEGTCRFTGTTNKFRNAYWQCYDGQESNEGGDTSCKTSETWQQYAKEACQNHCYADGSRCGVKTFKVTNECGEGATTRVSNAPAQSGSQPAPGTDSEIIKLQRQISDLEQKVIGLEKNLVTRIDQSLVNRVKGKILLQTQANGEAWYVDPASENKFYMKDGRAAYDIMRALGLGISNANLGKIPVGVQQNIYSLKDSDNDGIPDNLEVAIGTDPNKADTDGDGYDDKTEVLASFKPTGTDKYAYDTKLIDRVKGRILLQVESHGEAWYINPNDGKRYYLGDGNTAYNVMRFLSLGIKNDDLRKIQVGEFEE